jgi:hypothetical protein
MYFSTSLLIANIFFISQTISSRLSPESTRKSKPVAYFLPLENLSPIRIGRRVLRDSSSNSQETGQLSAGNRRLLTSYMAAVDSAAAASQDRPAAAATVTKPPPPQLRQQLSLQDALLTQRPNFVRRAEHRRAVIQRIRAARLRRAEKQEAWLEEVRALSPASRLRAQPTYSPVPQVKLIK